MAGEVNAAVRAHALKVTSAALRAGDQVATQAQIDADATAVVQALHEEGLLAQQIPTELAAGGVR